MKNTPLDKSPNDAQYLDMGDLTDQERSACLAILDAWRSRAGHLSLQETLNALKEAYRAGARDAHTSGKLAKLAEFEQSSEAFLKTKVAIR
jgi:hypothetical protein